MPSETVQSRRARERVKLSTPARVRGAESNGDKWYEVTRLIDVSPFGARFTLGRPVEPGRVIQVITPLPRPLRSFDFAEEQYKVWALTRYLRSVTPGTDQPIRFESGVAFIGKNPPSGYLEDPGKLFEPRVIGADQPIQTIEKQKGSRSDSTRLEMGVEVELNLLDSGGLVVERALTVTLNLSRRGAAVYAPFEVETGRFLLVKSAQFNIEVVATVRACRKDDRGVLRLHLEFLDREWPLDGLD